MNTPLVVGLVAWMGIQAREARVFVNGERADGLRDVVLEEVSVRIDAKGDIYITAPQYVVGGVSGESATEAAPPGEWWLVTEDFGSSSLEIQVVVNGRPVATIRSGQATTPLDLAPWLHRGVNQVEVLAPAAVGAGGGPLSISVVHGADGQKAVATDVRFSRDPSAASADMKRSFVVRIP